MPPLVYKTEQIVFSLRIIELLTRPSRPDGIVAAAAQEPGDEQWTLLWHPKT